MIQIILSKIKFLLFTLLICAFISNDLYADREQDSLALVAFYYAAGGANWYGNTTWLHQIPIDKWYGVYVNESGRVEEINLSNYMLSGEITSEIGNLSELKKLDLSNNNLFGAVPKEIGNITKLSNLNLKGNMISGLPPTLSNLTQLKALDISENGFEGAIPSGISNVLSLEILNLSYNKFKGKLSSQFDNLTNLKVLNLSNNKFTDTSRIKIGNFTELEILNISNNFLYGIKYNGIERLGQLREIDLSRNLIVDSIPKEIGKLQRLEVLNLSYNKCRKYVPNEIFQLKKLKILNLARNELKGEIPSEIKNLKDLEVLNISYNQISGVIPIEITNLTHLVKLNLHNNMFDFFDFANVGMDKLSRVEDFSYAPQGLLAKSEMVSKQIGESITIEAGDKYTKGNTYKWYREDILVENETNQTIYIEHLSIMNEGTYICEVRNEEFPNLILYRNPFSLTVYSPEFYINTSNSDIYQVCEGSAIELGNDIEINKNGKKIQDFDDYTILWENLDGSEFGSFDNTANLNTTFASNMLIHDRDTIVNLKLTVEDKNNPEINHSVYIYIEILKIPEAEWETIHNIEYNEKATIKIISRDDWIYKFYDSENSQIETTNLTQTDDLEWQTEGLITDISFWVEATREDGACSGARKEIKIISTSVDDNNISLRNSIDIYPNPASDLINIKIENDIELSSFEVQILDILGNIVAKSEKNNNNFSIDISNFSIGTYFININGKIEKFVKIN